MNPSKSNLSKLLAVRPRPDYAASTSTGSAKTTALVPASDDSSTKSPYFSPRRTRNQIQIKYEKDAINAINSRPKLLAVKKEPPAGGLTPITIASAQKPDYKPSIKFEPKSEPSSPKGGDDEASPSKQLKWQPPGWQRTLADIRKMRESQAAPVDTMGCHKCFDPMADERTQRFQILVALMLSSQTKDQVTYDAMNRLMRDGLTPESVASMEPEVLEQKLYPVSFYRNKAKFVQKTAQILIDRYASDIPATYAAMIALPGVGPKMAHICMGAAWHQVTGIGVDTHVHRITNRLRWTQHPTADAERTRVALEQWLPAELWADINPLLVGFGQTVCTPMRPKCAGCLHAERCPSRGVKQ